MFKRTDRLYITDIRESTEASSRPDPKDTYFLQKLVLGPLLDQATPFPSAGYQSMLAAEKEALASFIETNSFGPLWLEVVGKDIIDRIWSKQWRERLQKQYRNIAFSYASQLQTIRSVTKILDDHSIAHAVFKGAHTRELLYKNPAARSSCDIDLLIAEEDKNEVIGVLLAQGFRLSANPQNISHEASLLKNQIDLDLHWHIMRPGRIPRTLTKEFLGNRIRQDGYWSLGNEDNLFILLTHPVFTKYFELPRSSLILFLDLVLWLKQPIDFDQVHSSLKRTGLRTAAWITLEYFRLFTGTSTAEDLAKRLAPSPLKQRYLRQWIYKDLHSRFLATPLVPKLFFTLLAHDSSRNVHAFLKEFNFFGKPKD